MSEKWETVGKTKPVVKGGKAVNGGSGGPKKVIRPLPKLEDVLPKNSLDNVYSVAFELPPSPKPSPKKEKKEQPKAEAAKKAAAAKKEEKPRVPSTLQEAVKV
jgi:TMEM214, C-terminal, caspase 4 activator